ncbi:hypothetical protein PTKIN_Ptkin11bG0006400 [Pterospermum kingtungense]
MSLSLDSFLNSISPYDGNVNVMLAAVIFLLIVILFVLLLHVYAKWFLAQARHRSRSSSSSSMSVSHVFGLDRSHHFHAFTFDTTTFPSSPSKGLDPSAISSIPLFVYKLGKHKHGLECVICLSPFEDDDVGRNLPKCGHGFHVECIDKWLHFHSSCPICRAPVLSNDNKVSATSADPQASSLETLTDSSNADNNNNNSQIVTANDDNLSASSSSSSSFGCSLKRMLSRNRSDRKVFPSSNNASELQV